MTAPSKAENTPPPPTVGWVYFLKAGEFVKVGWSLAPEERVKHLQTGCPVETELLGFVSGSMDDEALFHALFEPWRSKGEWFHWSPVVRKTVSRELANEAHVRHLRTLTCESRGPHITLPNAPGLREHLEAHGINGIQEVRH